MVASLSKREVNMQSSKRDATIDESCVQMDSMFINESTNETATGRDSKSISVKDNILTKQERKIINDELRRLEQMIDSKKEEKLRRSPAKPEIQKVNNQASLKNTQDKTLECNLKLKNNPVQKSKESQEQKVHSIDVLKNQKVETRDKSKTIIGGVKRQVLNSREYSNFVKKQKCDNNQETKPAT